MKRVICVIGLMVFVSCSRTESSRNSTATVAPAKGTTARARQSNANPPWYPSLAAFEHHDSARTHLFPEATFGGDFAGRNTVGSVQGPSSYPSGWNVTYLDAGNIFLYGGGAGHEASSIGAYVAKIDPATLKPLWYRQLINTAQNGEWDYPGTIAILDDGMLYVIYGYHLSKLDPKSGEVVATVTLPTGDAAPGDTTYNGFSASADGVIVAKSFYRQAGCTVQEPQALLQCPDPSAVPSSVLVTVDRKTMTVLNQVTLPGEVIGRATVGRYQGKEYVYLFAQSGFIRYAIGPKAGTLTLDPSWTTGPLLTAGQTLGWAAVVMGDWVISQCNGLPASAPVSVYAVNQGDASKRFTIQPFANDPIPLDVKAAYRKQAPGGTAAVSFVPSTLSADPDTNLIYVLDALPGKIACFRLTPSGLQTAWQVSQTTTEFIAIIGPQDHRVIVTTSIPGAEIPGANKHDEVVWRNAATGEELARSERLPAMTTATMVQPSYSGNVFYPGLAGTLYKLLPAPKSTRAR